MNPDYLGDSYDVVKRFFCGQLKTLGYRVCIQPMLTGEWQGNEVAFFQFIGAAPSVTEGPRTALFFDPDTGVHLRPSSKHLSVQQLVDASQRHEIAFSFDQSFSRQSPPETLMRSKLSALDNHGAYGMYYNSHARFLFAASTERPLNELREHLLFLGLPAHRLLARGI